MITNLFDDLTGDFRLALRSLRKSRGFAAVAMITLTVCIGVSTAAFSVIHGVMFQPLPFQDPDRLVRITRTIPERGTTAAALPLALIGDIREQSQTPAAVAGVSTGRANLIDDGPPDLIEYSQVTAGYFELSGIRPVLGELLSDGGFASDGRQAAMITEGYWRAKWGGAGDVIGKSFQLEAAPMMTIVGILPDSVRSANNAALPTRVWTSATIQPGASRAGGGLFVVGRLNPARTVKSSQTELDTIAARLASEYPATDEGRGLLVQPLHDATTASSRQALMLFAASVTAVLLIGVLNLVNLQAARVSKRERDFAIQSALGASAWRLIRQTIVESTLLTGLAAGMGFVVVYWIRDSALSSVPALFPRMNDIPVDWRAFGFAICTAFACGVLIGVVPAIRAVRPRLIESLKEGNPAATGTPYHRFLRNALMVTETSLATLLLVGAGLLVHSFQQLTSVDPGFDARQIVTARVDLPQQRYEDRNVQNILARSLLDEIRAMPGVESVSVSNALPIEGGLATIIIAEEGTRGGASVHEVSADFASVHEVSADFASVLRIPVLFGRWMTADDVNRSAPVSVVSVSLARALWPGQNPIGKRFRWPSADSSLIGVVGVVPDVRTSMREEARAVVYTSYTAGFIPAFSALGKSMIFAVRLSTPTVPPLGATILRSEPNSTVRVRTMEDIIGNNISRQRFQTTMLASFATVAFVLAMIGIYSIVAFVTSQRTREIGLRVALGAKDSNVVFQMMRQGAIPAIAGLLIGLSASLWFVRFIETYLFRIEPTASWAYAAVLLAGTALIALASWLPARRAAHIDPVVALRHE